MTRGKRTIVAVVACVCAMFLSTARVEAEEITPSGFKVEEEQGSIVIQVVRREITPYVYRNGKTEQAGETTQKIVAYYISDGYETIESIATNLGISTEELVAVNDNFEALEKDVVYPKLRYALIKIPEVDWNKVSAKIYYYVEEGDCLWSISNYFGIEISDIIDCNTQEVSVCLNDKKDAWKVKWEKSIAMDKTYIEEIAKMTTAKQTMFLMEYPEDSTWWICRKITNPDVIYAGDFIRIK